MNEKCHELRIVGIPQKEGERLYLDGMELQRLTGYKLKHSAGKPTELTVTMEVIVDQSAFEQAK